MCLVQVVGTLSVFVSWSVPCPLPLAWLAAETVSIDPLRNAVLRFKDMGFICETPEATIAVVDSSKLQELTMDLVEFCR